MTRTVVALHETNETDLERVRKEMETLGAPTIRAIEVGDVLYAIEGTHRLAAAEVLGLEPTIEIVTEGPVTGLDLDDHSVWGLDELAEVVARHPIDRNRALYRIEVRG